MRLLPDPFDLTDEDEELALLADPRYSDHDRNVLQKEAAEPEQCDAEVWERPSYFRKHQCPHPGKCWVNNKWLCGIHAKVEDRRTALRWR
jgi:hypothetical protein